MAQLTIGLHSVKGGHYAQYRGVEQRLSRVVGALDRISRALVDTAEGPENLVLSVARAVSEHLDARWVVFALCDGELERTGPRHLMMAADGTVYAFEGWPAAGCPATCRTKFSTGSTTSCADRPIDWRWRWSTITICTCRWNSTAASSVGCPHGPVGEISWTPQIWW